MTSRITHDDETTNYAERIELHRKAYLERLVIQGYSITARGEYEHIINRFCEELGNFPPGKQKVDGVAIEALRETVLNGLHERKCVCAKHRLGRFIDYLAEAGAIPPLEPPAKEAAATDELFSEYGDYLGTSPAQFFRLDTGLRPTDCTTRYTFAKVCQNIGLRNQEAFYKHGRGPRIHDLRHTFAARTIIEWYKEGLNPDREMFNLSTYLGHAKAEHTYWYIEAVPELLQLACQRAERSLAGGGAR